MNGGKVRIVIPSPDDWAIKVGNVTVQDGDDLLFLTSARLSDNEFDSTGIRGPAPKAGRGLRRVTLLTTDKDNVKQIDVELDGTAWSVDRAGTRSLIITVTGATVPIPASLRRVDGVPYQNYQFTTSSTTTSSFRRLTDNDLGEEAQPSIKVGNIAASGAGELAVTPDMYVGDEGDVKIKFTAKGPIYDIDLNEDADFTDTGDVDAQIVVNLNDSIEEFRILPSRLPKTVTVNGEEVKVNPPPAVTLAHVAQLAGLSGDGGPNESPGKSGYISVRYSKATPAQNPVTVDTDR